MPGGAGRRTLARSKWRALSKRTKAQTHKSTMGCAIGLDWQGRTLLCAFVRLCYCALFVSRVRGNTRDDFRADHVAPDVEGGSAHVEDSIDADDHAHGA